MVMVLAPDKGGKGRKPQAPEAGTEPVETTTDQVESAPETTDGAMTATASAAEGESPTGD
jgi:hypothetical protein